MVAWCHVVRYYLTYPLNKNAYICRFENGDAIITTLLRTASPLTLFSTSFANAVSSFVMAFAAQYLRQQHYLTTPDFPTGAAARYAPKVWSSVADFLPH